MFSVVANLPDSRVITAADEKPFRTKQQDGLHRSNVTELKASSDSVARSLPEAFLGLVFERFPDEGRGILLRRCE